MADNETRNGKVNGSDAIHSEMHSPQSNDEVRPLILGERVPKQQLQAVSVITRKLEEGCKPEFVQWILRLAERNNLDPKILTYPATEVLQVQNPSRRLLYLPIQKCFFLESLAISPENSAGDTARALNDAFTVIKWEAINAGHGEIYFACKDEETRQFVENPRRGFDLMDFPIYRMKLL